MWWRGCLPIKIRFGIFQLSPLPCPGGGSMGKLVNHFLFLFLTFWGLSLQLSVMFPAVGILSASTMWWRGCLTIKIHFGIVQLSPLPCPGGESMGHLFNLFTFLNFFSAWNWVNHGVVCSSFKFAFHFQSRSWSYAVHLNLPTISLWLQCLTASDSRIE